MSEQSSSWSGLKLHSLDLGQATQAVKEAQIKTVKQFLMILMEEFIYDGVVEDLQLAGNFRLTHPKSGTYNISPGPDPDKALDMLPGVEPGKALDILLLKSYALALQTGNKPVQDALSNALQAHSK
jgi:hypothetical protein